MLRVDACVARNGHDGLNFNGILRMYIPTFDVRGHGILSALDSTQLSSDTNASHEALSHQRTGKGPSNLFIVAVTD